MSSFQLAGARTGHSSISFLDWAQRCSTCYQMRKTNGPSDSFRVRPYRVHATVGPVFGIITHEDMSGIERCDVLRIRSADFHKKSKCATLASWRPQPGRQCPRSFHAEHNQHRKQCTITYGFQALSIFRWLHHPTMPDTQNWDSGCSLICRFPREMIFVPNSTPIWPPQAAAKFVKV